MWKKKRSKRLSLNPIRRWTGCGEGRNVLAGSGRATRAPARARPESRKCLLLLLVCYSLGAEASDEFPIPGYDRLGVDNSGHQVVQDWSIEGRWLFDCDQAWIFSDFRIQPGERIDRPYTSADLPIDAGYRSLTYLSLAVSWRDTRYGQVRESGLVLQPRAGFRLMLGDSLSLDTSIGYSLVEDDLLLLDFDSHDSSWQPGIGLQFRF